MLELDPRRRLKVGLFTAALLVLLALVILVIGKKQGMFTRHVAYKAQFQDVAGLVPGAQVWLNGVVVGVVESVDLPEDPAQRRITVTFRVRKALAARIRADSRVRIRTLGLLGDRYLELSSGSPLQPLVPEGGMVPSGEPTDIAEALSQGGEAIGNVVAITGSLRRILEKMERGEGALGALVNEPFDAAGFSKKLNALLDDTGAVMHQIRQGQGLLGKLAVAPKGKRCLPTWLPPPAAPGPWPPAWQDVSREDTVLASILRDPKGREKLTETLSSLAQASTALAAASQELATGQGTLPRLLRDKEFADSFLADLAQLTHALASVADKLDRGQGSAGRMVNDPQLYEDLESVVRGVQQSRLLRWFVRNRREAGERASATPTPGGG
jgi:phospholipid/cholesterol/gamma-HCH transport system substrate-binding protein